MMGELYQNNHHYKPNKLNFAVKWFEYDFGFLATKLFEKNAIDLLVMSSVAKDYERSNNCIFCIYNCVGGRI